MTDRLAPPPYVVLAKRATAGTNPADGDDLANINVAPLPNRAMCWAADTLYQLDKSQTGTTIVVNGVALQVAPNNGGGLWLPVVGAAATALSFTVTKPAGGNIGAFPDDNTWTTWPNAVYTIEGAASILPFTINNNGCILTYSGPDKYFLVSSYATLAAGQAALAGFCRHAIDLNSALVTTTTAVQYEGRATLAEAITAVSYAHMFTQSKLLLTSGDTIRPVAARSFDGATGIAATINNFRLTVQELEAA